MTSKITAFLLCVALICHSTASFAAQVSLDSTASEHEQPAGVESATQPAEPLVLQTPWLTVWTASLDRAESTLKGAMAHYEYSKLEESVGIIQHIRAIPGISDGEHVCMMLHVTDPLDRDPFMIFALPANNVQAVIDYCGQLEGLSLTQTAEDRWSLIGGNQPLYLCSIDRWMLVSSHEDLLTSPELILERITPPTMNADLSFRFQPSGLPRSIRTDLKRQLDLFNHQIASLLNLTDTTKRDLGTVFEAAIYQGIHDLVSGATESVESIDFGIRRDNGLHLELSFLAKEQSSLAVYLRQAKLPHATLKYPVHPAERQRLSTTFSVAFSPPEPVLNVLDSALRIANEKLKRDAKQLLHEEELKTIQEALKTFSNVIDQRRVEYRVEYIPNDRHLTFFSAMTIPDAIRVEPSLQRILKSAEVAGELRNVQLELVHEGDLSINSTQFRKVRELDRRLYGQDPRLLLGTDHDTFYLCGGEGDLEHYFQQISTNTILDPPLLELQIHFRPWLKLLAHNLNQTSAFQEIDRVLADEFSKDRIHFRVTAEDRRLNLSLSTESGFESLLKLAEKFFPTAKAP